MATKFLEPGGDSTFNVAATSAKGLWDTVIGTPAVVTDFVHGAHIKSIKFRPGSTDYVQSFTMQDSGTRGSFYVYFNVLPNAVATILNISQTTTSNNVWRIRITSGGVLQIWNSTVQLGSNGSTLTAGTWYRISFAYTLTNTTTYTINTFFNGASDISVTNGSTLAFVTSNKFLLGNSGTNATLDMRVSDIYIDDSNALTDTGNIWVTAKRPNANGTTNGFTTQIGSGGSGYGTGHSPQVNERPTSSTNGWSMVGAGSAVTEEYNIEGKSVGDIDISSATIVDWVGWIDTKSLVGETVQIILDGANNSQAITSTETLFTKVKGSSTYPSGTGADIGMTTDTSLTTVSLYDAGVIVAYIPSSGADTINVSDTTVVSESVNVDEVDNISVSDTTAISESITMEMFSYISVSDTSVISDTPKIFIPILLINVSDTTVITELVTLQVMSSINVSDTTTITELVSIGGVLSFVASQTAWGVKIIG